jgi:acyl-CoA synthetase (AMP-forming)/AMP-acid ligase II
MGATMIVNTLTHWTWRELDDASSRLALNLLNFGLQRGDRVASLMPNRDELLVLYLSCMKAGFIATPLNYRYQAPEIDHALEVSGARLLIAHAERDADLLDCQLLERLQLGVIQFQAADASGPTLDELIQRESAAIAIQRPEPNDPAIIFFTSGSTGRPKGVTHSFASVGWMLASAGDYTKLQSRSVRLRRIS